MKLDVLFLGRLFPKEAEAEIKSKMKTGMRDAGNALQWNIIDGLEANECGKIKILNYLPVDSYPRGYSDVNMKKFVFQHTDKYQANDLNVGCTNLTIVKQFANGWLFEREIKKWLATPSEMKKVIMIYTADSMSLSLAKYAKKICPEVEICCIIADIPEFDSAVKLHGIKKIYNDYKTWKSSTLYRYVDKFVLLTRQMAQKLKIEVPFTVIEGISTSSDEFVDEMLSQKYQSEKFVLYTGTLNFCFGIGNLVEAFSRMPDKDVKLIICGFGEAEEMIKEKQKTDDRIVYLGRVDRKQVLALQRKATVLVNPRQNNEEFTKYSFPSKNLEYLSAGVPVIAYKLDGIPDEYDDYLLYPVDDEVDSLTDVLKKVCSMEDEQRNALGEKGKKFVLNEKNSVAQTRKIIDLLCV